MPAPVRKSPRTTAARNSYAQRFGQILTSMTLVTIVVHALLTF